MEFSFFQSLLFGFFSGLSDILPVSAQAHKKILMTVFGVESEPVVMRLLLHLAVLAALYTCCRSQIQRIVRQLKLSKVPKRRRKRPLDVQVLMDFRLLRTIAIPAVIVYLFYQKTSALNGSLSWIALFALINAVILFLPNLLPTGNKDSRSLSPVEGLMMGLGGGIGILPGVSSMGGMLSVASACGVERKFAMTLALLVQMVITVMMIVFDIAAMISGIGTLSVTIMLGYLAAAAAAFGGVCLGVRMMHGLAENNGYNVFAFYSLAAAFLSFILYLMV